MQTLKVGFIGAGFIARFHALAMTQVRGVNLAGVTAPEGAQELARWARANGLGDCKVCPDVQSLCNICDVAAILAPNYARIPVMTEIVKAVKKGATLKGVICEKPLGRTVAEARQLIALAKKAALPTAYFENQIHMKPMRLQLAQLAPQQRNRGPMSLARSAEEHAGPHMPWFWDPTRQGGGVLSDMACHAIACSWYVLNPIGKPADFLEPIAISADIALLKWGRSPYREQLLERMGVDYAKTPAEDFATGMITFRNPETGQISKGQFNNSWMYDKQGLRLLVEGLGPGYAFEVNSLQSPLNIFIGDEAAEAAADLETALEKSTSSRGLIPVIPNEADLYGYVDEWIDARDAFLNGRPPLLDWSYGLKITRLCVAAYKAAEEKRTLNLTDPRVLDELETHVPLVAQGRGAEVLSVG